MLISNKTKSGFRALGDVRILDHTGAPFYGTRKGTEFNLPMGNYEVLGDIERLPFAVPYEMQIYPLERSDRKYSKVIVNVVDNPHKASVIFRDDAANIFMDPSIAALPLACRCYVIAHECGHAHYYGDNPQDLECKCDAHGEQLLIDLGWNPTQLRAANKLLLKSGWRKNECEKRMLKQFAKK